MDVKKYLETIHLAEGLKDELRHCYTSKGRHESVAEHSWRITLISSISVLSFVIFSLNLRLRAMKGVFIAAAIVMFRVPMS